MHSKGFEKVIIENPKIVISVGTISACCNAYGNIQSAIHSVFISKIVLCDLLNE